MPHLIIPLLAAAASVLSTAAASADLGDQLAKPLPNDGAAEGLGQPATVNDAARIVPYVLVGDPIPNPRVDGSVIRSQRVRIDHAALANLQPGRGTTLDLFDDVSVQGVVLHRQEQSASRFTIYGRIDSLVDGEFLLAINRDAVAGVIRAPGTGSFHLRSGPDDLQTLDELILNVELDCLTGQISLPRPGDTKQDPTAGGDCDDGSVIDVLVVYTPEARTEAGGVAAMEAQIDLAIAFNNLIYDNSLVNPQMHLVYAWQLDIDEADVSLPNLMLPDDGYMDGVHTLRQAYGADQVVLVRTGHGGLAAGLWNLNPEMEANAFCIVGYLSMPLGVVAHELGHNMGCCHALGDGGGCPPEGGLLFPYSNGHRFVGDSGELWRTVMAYFPGTLITQFSNPEVLFDGQPTGIAEGERGEADNAKTINLAAFTVSNWRCNDGICEGLDLPSDAADCNGNEVPDACDIAIGLSKDLNNNGVPDECECLWDLDGSGSVGVPDLLSLLISWGSCEDCPADFDGDGNVGVPDLLALLANWGPCP